MYQLPNSVLHMHSAKGFFCGPQIDQCCPDIQGVSHSISWSRYVEGSAPQLATAKGTMSACEAKGA